MLKNPSYSGITTEFWNSLRCHLQVRSLDAVGHAQLRKRAAMQTMGTGMGFPARFRNVHIGTAFSDQ